MDLHRNLKIAFIGKKAVGKSFAADYLVKNRTFKRMRLEDGITKFIRYMYAYRPHQRVKWETRYEMYNALYKIDNEIFIDYLLRKLETVTMDVVVDDAKYLNEVDKLKKAGFIIVRISSPRGVTRFPGAKTASSGYLSMYEYFGTNFDYISVDYSIMNENRDKTKLMLDRIVDKERAKLLELNKAESSANSTQGGEQFEEEISTLNETAS
jgi:hypothetical protein